MQIQAYQHYLKNIQEITNYFVLLKELTTLISSTNEDELEDLVITDLFTDYKDGKEYYISEHTNKRHQIIKVLFDMIKNKDILPFKKYCHQKIELISLQDFFLNTLNLDKTLVDYIIHSEYNLFNGNIFIVIHTLNEKMTLKIVFDTDDIIIGIWIVEFNKHNA